MADRLDAGVIHLWRLPYESTLGRAPLIELLAAYLQQPAEAVRLVEAAGGKPRLQLPAGEVAAPARFEFNWSHSGRHALVALARDVPVGVDVEHLAKHPRALDIARRYFDPAEADALEALEPGARRRAFIELWCAKEAVLKVGGEGLSFGLARVPFAYDRARGWTLAHVDPALAGGGALQLVGFDAAPDYRGALAWPGGARRIVGLRPRDRHG